MSALVVFHKQLGDTVLLEPVLRKLAAASGGQVSLVCSRNLEPLISLMPHTRLAAGRQRWLPDCLWAYDWGSRTIRASLPTLCRDKHLVIPNPLWVRFMHRRVFRQIHPEPYEDRYISRYFWDVTSVAGGEGVFTPVRLESPPAGWAAPDWRNEPYLLLNPVSAWKRKNYDAPKWARVLAHVRSLGLPRVVMSGGTDDWQREHCAEIAAAAAALGVAVEDISGRTTLPQFMHLVSRARMVLCVDGAAAHLARGFSVPCVTIFGPSYRSMWHLEDALNAALDASDFSSEQRPSATLVPPEAVMAAVTRLAASAAPTFA